MPCVDAWGGTPLSEEAHTRYASTGPRGQLLNSPPIDPKKLTKSQTTGMLVPTKIQRQRTGLIPSAGLQRTAGWCNAAASKREIHPRACAKSVHGRPRYQAAERPHPPLFTGIIVKGSPAVNKGGTTTNTYSALSSL